MKLAWYSPMPPMASGISDYSIELLPLVAERATVDVVCPGMGWLRRPRIPAGLRRIDPAGFGERARGYDAVLYHLGNNPFHEFAYEAALARPGVLVLHDFVMHHLIAHLMVEAGRQRERYETLMRAEYGRVGARLTDLRVRRIATDYEKFVFPLNGHLARASKAIVVHSHDSADRIREAAPDVPVSVIPHHAGRPPTAVAGVTRAEARRRLRLPERAFVVGHFGYITRPKQPAAVVGGFAKLAARHPDALLVMAGADRTGGGLGALIRRLEMEERVRLTGYVDLEHFYLYLRAADAVVNLRYPSAGESSGTFARALAEGRATLVNDLGSFAEVPSDVTLKVEVDGDQAAEVGAHLLRLAEDAAFRWEIEANASAYAARFLDPIRCRDLYLDVAASAAARA